MEIFMKHRNICNAKFSTMQSLDQVRFLQEIEKLCQVLRFFKAFLTDSTFDESVY